MDDMFRAARAEITVWNAATAGIADVSRCGLRGSPTVVKKVFAPQPRTDKAAQIEVSGTPEAIADAALELLGARDSKLAARFAATSA
jgi:electron transfer flavoprotein beta subunit